MQETQGLARQCAEKIQESSRIALLSGAGMSTNAGLPDFRGPNGIYRRADIEEPDKIFELRSFQRHPEFFYQFHREFLNTLERIVPSFSHRFFAALEQEGKLSGIITQNIDALHQRAGNTNVLEIHGGIWESSCQSCGKTYGYDETRRKTFAETVPACDDCGGVLKPNIVFFGEMVRHLDECQELVRSCDLLFVVGSSLVVTPAAMLPSMTSGDIIVVNKGELSSAYLSPQRISIYAEEDIDSFFKDVDTHLGLLTAETS